MTHNLISKYASDDLVHGQAVIVTARWVLVLVGFFLLLVNPDPAALGLLQFQIMVLLMLAVANFYLWAQVLMRRPTLDVVVYGASLADLAVITAIIISEGGFEAGAYVFYFPALLAISVAFPTAMLHFFTGGAITAYASIGLMTATTTADWQVLVVRLLMLASVAVCGNLYWRIERGRRQAAVEAAQKTPLTPLPEIQALPAIGRAD